MTVFQVLGDTSFYYNATSEVSKQTGGLFFILESTQPMTYLFNSTETYPQNKLGRMESNVSHAYNIIVVFGIMIPLLLLATVGVVIVVVIVIQIRKRNAYSNMDSSSNTYPDIGKSSSSYGSA